MSSVNMSVLLLNKGYMPINVINAKRAFTLLYSNLAEVVSVDDNHYLTYNFESWAELSELKKKLQEETGLEDWVETPNLLIEIPRVIKLINNDVYPREDKVRLSRRNIFIRDNYTCQYCGKRKSVKELQLEHVIPRAQGGIDSWTNLVCSCGKCNNKKGAKTPKQAGMKLLREPFKPTFTPDFRIKANLKKYISWRNFISEIYWDIELEGT